MTSRSLILRTAAVALSLLMSGAVAADPPSITGLSSSSRLTPEEKDQIDEYAGYWITRLGEAAEHPEDVRPARRALIDPLRRGSTSDVFRGQYGRALMDGLGRLADEPNPHIGVTALIVLSQIGTDRALDALVDRCSLAVEPRGHLRLTAARGCADLIRRPNRAPLSAKDLTTAARRLRDAARDETNRLALRHQVAAVLAASEHIEENAAGDDVRAYLVQAFERTAERAGAASIEDDPVGLLDAIYPTLNGLRASYFDLSAREQRSFGAALGPSLQKLLDVAHAHWAALEQDPAAREELGQIINLCEVSLRTVDRFVRNADPPDTALKKAWDDRDANRYERDLQRWRDILDKPPYKSR